MKKLKLNLPLRPILAAVLIILILLFIAGIGFNFLATSDYFRIRDVIARYPNSADLSYLKGKNMFSLDLKRESRFLLQFYPDFSSIRIIRVLPNRLFVDFVKRKPIAIVRLTKNFSIDKYGVFFSAPSAPEESNLPVIAGLERKITGARPGMRYNVRELNLALNILNEIRKNRVFREFSIKRIDVATIGNAAVYFPFAQKIPEKVAVVQAAPIFEDLEVKLGADNTRDEISFLAGLFLQYKNDLPNIKYIDLRFKEPTIKYKDVK
jgi:hypothetical protein